MITMVIYKELVDYLNSHLLQFCTLYCTVERNNTAINGTASLFRFSDIV